MVDFSKIDIFIRKIIGWILLSVGLIIILWALLSSYNIFTAKKEVPVLFEAPKTEKVSLQTNQEEPSATVRDLENQAQKIIEGQLREQIQQVIPSEFIAKIFNLISWAFFVAIAIFAGSQIAGLGTKLLKA